MREGELGDIFLKNLMAAVTWAAIFLIAFFVMVLGVKQEVKEGIQYAFATAAQEGVGIYPRENLQSLLTQALGGKSVRDEAQLREGIKAFLNDPEVRSSLKDIFESQSKEKP
jgi:hypothetical protein